MFQQQMKIYKLEKPSIVSDELNQPITTYIYNREVEMAICLDTHAFYRANDTDITNIEVTALSRDHQIEKGDRINNQYIVSFVEHHRLFSIVHMREINNNGRF